MSDEKNPLQEETKDDMQQVNDSTGNPFPSNPPVNCDNPDGEDASEDEIK